MRNSKSCPLLLLTFLVLIFSASVAQAGEISPALQTLLDYTDADKPVSVLVHFQNRVDIQDLSAQLSTRKATRQQRHAEIVYALQDAARVQDELALELDSASADRGILGYTRYWIANVMVVYAVPAEIERIALRGDVDYLEPNFEPELIKPVDVRSIPQGAETDSRGIGLTPGLTAVRAPEVWSILGIDGSGALIASLDTGVDGNHPAFSSRWRGLEADPAECWIDVLGNNTTFPVDNHGHGTHTVGTMTGVAPDDTIGIAPGAQWIAANAIDQGSSSGFDNDIIECFQFFTDPDGDPATIADVPDVVQNSWGVNENFDGYFDCDERWWDAIDNCEAAGVVVVWSAGNEGPGAESLRSPADRATTIYNCFSVGSTLTSAPYDISSFSSRGPSGCFVIGPTGGIKPEVSAPGTDIYSAQPGGGYQYMSGTSMAGPHVSGVVALMRSANPDLEVNALKQIMMDTAVDLGTAGEDNTYGWGIIDAYAAVEACMTGFGTLNGQVTNGSFGDLPLAGATVEIPSRGAMLTTTASGNYQTSLPFGEYEIVVSYPGFETRTISNVIVYEDLETTMDVALTDIAGPVLSNPTGELATSDTVGPYTIGVQAADPSTVSSVELNWLQIPLDWNTVVMTPAGNSFTAEIPGHNANTQIVYFFSAEDGLGQDSQLPEASLDEVFSLYVTQTTYATDAEDPGDPDWQLGVTGDDATSGLWVRADPVGTEYNGTVIQPENDHTSDPGNMCFVTGNATPGDGAGTEDVDGGCTTLQTPVFDLSAADRAVIKYWAWFRQGGNATDDDFVVEVSNDNGVNWVEMHRIAGNTADWTQVNVDLKSLLDGSFELTNQIVVRFLACDLNTGGLVEVAIDDFAIETFVANDTSPVPDVPNSMSLVVLHQNHPNPFNPSTTISFNLPRAAAVELGVFGIDGRRVATLVNESLPSGEHQATWRGLDDGGRSVASGAYFYRLQVEGKLQVKRMVLLK